MKTILATLGALALLFGALMLDPLSRARTLNSLWMGTGSVWGILILMVAIGIGFYLWGTRVDSWLPYAAGVIIVIVGGVFLFNFRGWVQESQYAAQITTQEAGEEYGPLAARAPFTVAERQASSSLSGINGTLSGTKYLPGTDTYSTLVSKPGVGNPGYTALVSQKIALTGQAKGSTCHFDDAANRRMDGWFGNSLTRAIARVDSNLVVEEKDVWGYCDGEKPMVVVPVARFQNWFAPILTPAGVAIYDGSNGSVIIKHEVKAGELAGPVVPLSYAEKVNASARQYEGDFFSAFFGTTGLTDQPKGEDDPNHANATNFALKAPGGSAYVSPFTHRSASQTIDMVSVLDIGSVVDGQRPILRLYPLTTPRQSNAATADKIKADYNSLAWASGLTVQEIVPVSQEEWAASVGLNQNVTHRVTLLTDGSSKLYAAGADPETAQPSNPEPGVLPGAQGGAPGLEKFSDKELAQELARRLGSK